MTLYFSEIVTFIFTQVQQSGDEAKDEPGTNRFNAVIEKIERLYMVCCSYTAIYFCW